MVRTRCIEQDLLIENPLLSGLGAPPRQSNAPSETVRNSPFYRSFIQENGEGREGPAISIRRNDWLKSEGARSFEIFLQLKIRAQPGPGPLNS
jgi:hypothetical protein